MDWHPRVDYDAIAPLYDEPARDHAVDSHVVDLLTEADPGQRPLIVDLGCGTGKQLAANLEAAPTDLAQFVGLDYSIGMLKQAQRRAPQVQWIQGDNARLPFRAGCVHYATNQFSYSHVRTPSRMWRQIYTILRPAAKFLLTHIDPWEMPGWLVYRFFPEACQRDKRDFIPVGDLCHRLASVGFVDIHVDRRQEHPTRTLGEFLAYAERRYRTSQLMAIDDGAYARGMARLRQTCTRQGADRILTDELCFVTITCSKPEGQTPNVAGQIG